MASNVSRPLHTTTLAYEFLSEVIGIPIRDIDATEVVEKELMLKNFDPSQVTLISQEYRVKHKSGPERQELRTQIYQDLISQNRIDNELEITLGNGGGLPKSTVKSDKHAVIIMGLPASGKSSLASKLADAIGGVLLDCDVAKPKFPEFAGFQFGASLVHEESNGTIFGFQEHPEQCLLHHSITRGYNLVIPKIGHNHKSILDLTKVLKNTFNYNVSVVLVRVDRKTATVRAYRRFQHNNRYVPLSLIFDGYSNNPTITYFWLKTYHRRKFKYFACLHNEVALGNAMKVEECKWDLLKTLL